MTARETGASAALGTGSGNTERQRERRDGEEGRQPDDVHPLSRRGIERENEALLRRYGAFRRGADAVAAAWRAHPAVVKISLIGSVAQDPWKEVPRFQPYRRAGIVLWHECKDVDLALWLRDLGSLNILRKARARALRALLEKGSIGIASHQVDVFVLEPGTDRYLGRLCDFNACPKGRPECRVPGCGTVSLLRRHEEFCWYPESLADGRAVPLFDRAAGLRRCAADLPLFAARGNGTETSP